MQSNLPTFLTPFFGRQSEMAEVFRLLERTRLLTLTGPGGSGKTRLSIEAASQITARFPDGVWLVDFSHLPASTSDEQAVFRAVSAVFGLSERGDVHPRDALIGYLHHRSLLLILDNCEHIVETAALLAHSILTSTSASVKIMATSQIPLGIVGEVEWAVPTLPFPESADTHVDVEALLEYPAVRLFVDRASAVQPDFTLTPYNADAVVKICRKLDGIPLAIELAAARVKFLGVDGLATRLDDRFNILSAPRRMVAARHQTLQAMVDWSFALLSSKERRLLLSLAVFNGSWSLEAAEAVCSDEQIGSQEVMGLIGQLVDHSLVVVLPGGELGTRYRLLETVRLYGLAHLSESEIIELRNRHLIWCTNYSMDSDRRIHSPEQAVVMRHLDAEAANLHAALEWAKTFTNSACLLSGIQLAGALCWYWRIRGALQYGVEIVSFLLSRAEDETGPDWTAARAYAYYGLSWLTFVQGDTRCIPSLEKSRQLWDLLGREGRSGYAMTTSLLARFVIENTGDAARARALCDECVRLYEDLQEPWGMAETTFHAGIIAELSGDLQQAEERYRSALESCYQLGDRVYTGLVNIYLSDLSRAKQRLPEAVVFQLEAYHQWKSVEFVHGVAISLETAGDIMLEMGKLEKAEECYTQAIPYFEKAGLNWKLALMQNGLGRVRLYQQRSHEAEQHFRRAVEFMRGSGRHRHIARYLYGVAAAIAHKRPWQAARIVGHADLLFRIENLVTENPPADITQRTSTILYQLGEKAYRRAIMEGQELTIDEVLSPEMPAKEKEVPPTLRKQMKQQYSGLTSREREIAILITRGYSNPDIARAMTISERTVTTHVTNILSKLGFSSRAQVAAWVVESGLSERPDGEPAEK